jgi:hypothetical protein
VSWVLGLRKIARVAAERRAIERGRNLLAESFMRSFVVVLNPESIESALLGTEA